MSLVKCPECGKEISDKAKECIHCGYPINPEVVYDIPVFLKPSDVYKILGCGKNKGYKIISSKAFPRIQIGKRYYIPRDKFLRWMSTYLHGEFKI